MKIWMRLLRACQEHWQALLCLVCFAVLAFPSLQGSSHYVAEEPVRDVLVIERLAAGEIILQGPPSMLRAFSFGPAYYYISAPLVFLFGFSAFALALTSWLSQVAALWIGYWLALRWFRSKPLALFTLGVGSFSILSFLIAQYGSNPNSVPFFSLLFFYALERCVAKKATWFTCLLLGVSYGIIVQLHAVPLISLTLIIILLIARGKLSLRLWQWLLFSSTALLVNGLYVYYEFTHYFINFRGIISLSAHPTIYVGVIERLLDFATFVFSIFLSLYPFFDAYQQYGYLLLVFLSAAALAGMCIYFFEKKRERTAVQFSDSVKITLRYWVVIVTALLLLPIGGVAGIRYYYCLILWWPLCLLVGYGLYSLWVSRQLVLLYFIASVFIALQLFQIFVYRLIF